MTGEKENSVKEISMTVNISVLGITRSNLISSFYGLRFKIKLKQTLLSE